MHLILDIGNSKIKYHLFEQKVRKNGGDLTTMQGLEAKLLLDYPAITDVIYSDVSGKYSLKDVEKLFPRLRVKTVKQMRLPFQSHYTTSATLGEDRIALVAAAVLKFPQQNCLIIDAGSCLTFDLLTQDNIYLGGAISPGMAMRYKSMHHFTGKLPLTESREAPKLWGDSTENALSAGVIQGMLHEIDGQIESYLNFFSSLTVILTGGDAQYLSKSVKNTIFAKPNFLAEGLDYLLDYNKN